MPVDVFKTAMRQSIVLKRYFKKNVKEFPKALAEDLDQENETGSGTTDNGEGVNVGKAIELIKLKKDELVKMAREAGIENPEKMTKGRACKRT